jgi:MOSC domain-containing protein YiiM
MPCYKLALRFDRDDIIKRFMSSQRSGFYFSVMEEGEVQGGSKVEILTRDPVESPSWTLCASTLAKHRIQNSFTAQ